MAWSCEKLLRLANHLATCEKNIFFFRQSFVGIFQSSSMKEITFHTRYFSFILFSFSLTSFKLLSYLFFVTHIPPNCYFVFSSPPQLLFIIPSLIQYTFLTSILSYAQFYYHFFPFHTFFSHYSSVISVASTFLFHKNSARGSRPLTWYQVRSILAQLCFALDDSQPLGDLVLMHPSFLCLPDGFHFSPSLSVLNLLSILRFLDLYSSIQLL